MTLFFNKIILGFLIYALVFIHAILDDGRPEGSIPTKIENNAGSPIELYWININTPQRELVKQTKKPLRHNSFTRINSYDTHQFSVQFLDPSKGAPVTFTKGPREETVYIGFDPKTKSLTVRQSTSLDDYVEKIQKNTESCNGSSSDHYAECVANSIIDDITKIQDSKQIIEEYRNSMAERIRNYTCADETLETSEPIEKHSFEASYEGKAYAIKSLLHLETAKIFYIENFVTQEECDIMIEHGRPKLERATVADELGNSVVSQSRKAQQAEYDSDFSDPRDPLFKLYDRSLAITNGVGKLHLSAKGQEGFTLIQYDPTDEYLPHCDGSCTGEDFIEHGRVATGLLYCKVPERGGATVFSRADIIVKPKPLMALFFVYKGENGKMDNGLTEHSGCPVIEGEKWISTLWLREGVSEKQPWTLYDPQGVLILEEKDLADSNDEL